MGELSGSDIGSEVGAKKELVRVVPEKIPYIENEMDGQIIDGYVSRINEMFVRYGDSPDFSYTVLLSGETNLSYKMPKSIEYNSLIVNENLYPDFLNRNNGRSTPVNTGVDLNYLITQYPIDRCKFYLSLDTSSPQKEVKAKYFLKEFIEKCKEYKLSLLIKTDNHDYDNPDIYTWQPITMARVLRELYQKPEYAGIWYDTPHFFQRPLKEVSEKHIGFVQEPVLGFLGDTHSWRMSHLGQVIDSTISRAHNGGEIGFLTFFDAAKKAGVEPTQPWRIDRHRLDEQREYFKTHKF